MRLAGKRVLITGANGGIGAALAEGMAAEGARIILHSRSRAAGDEVRARIESAGGEAAVVTGDVAVAEQVGGLAADAVAVWAGVDVLVNNAGVMSTAPFLELSAAEWARVIGTNLTGYFLVGQALARHMAERGSGAILNVSSTRQVQAWPGSAAYASSKGGIAMLTRIMALELAEVGVRVNSIAPGTFVTNLNREYAEDPEFRGRRESSIPLGRYGRLDELVGASVFLCSDDATYVTGASLTIDGGQTLW